MPRKQLPPHPLANDNVIESTALELALPQRLVREVVAAQSEFCGEKIREGGFEGVMLPLFGKVKVKISKVQAFYEKLGGENVKKNTEINDKVI